MKERVQTALDILAEQLPELPDSERASLEARIGEPRTPYPFGSGQGDEIGLRAGLRPMIRELLPEARIPSAIERYARLGFSCEVASTLYGPTTDGWLNETLVTSSPTTRSAVFVGRDRGALEDAVRAELDRNDAEAITSLGRLLGYPRCCVSAFVETSRERRASELHAAALARTTGRPRARLNGLDLAVFHFVPWSPCSYECPHSLRYADALAERVERVRPAFVASIDRALGRARLMLCSEVQLSIDGAWDGHAVRVEAIEPTAIDRDPRAPLGAVETSVVARALRWLRGAKTVAVLDERLFVDGAPRDLVLPGRLPLLVPFGPA